VIFRGPGCRPWIAAVLAAINVWEHSKVREIQQQDILETERVNGTSIWGSAAAGCVLIDFLKEYSVPLRTSEEGS